MPNDREGPVAEWHQRLQLAARQALSPEDVTEIIAGIVKDAKRGDKRARELVLKFLQMGQPPADQAPQLQPPAQQVKANVVNIYAGRRKKPMRVIGNGRGREGD